MRWRLLGFGAIYAPVMAGTIFGFGPDEKFKAVLSPWEAKMGGLITYPSLFLIGAGLGIGAYFVPIVYEFFVRKKKTEEEYKNWLSDDTARAKQIFFTHMGKALTVYWKYLPYSGAGGVPSNINLFIDKAPYPEWLPPRGTYHANFELYIHVDDPYWRFARELYNQIDGCLYRGIKPTLLTEDEIREFHEARRQLAYFWARIARNIFHSHTMRYKDVIDWIRSDERVLKYLAYLEVSLHLTTMQQAEGKTHLFHLGAKYFGTEWALEWKNWVGCG